MLTVKTSPVFSVTLQHVGDAAVGSRRINNTDQVTIPARRLQLLPSSSAQLLLHRHARTSSNKGRNVVAYSNGESGGGAAVPSPAPSSSSGGFDWKGWLVGVIMSVLLPFWRGQLWSLKKIQVNVESVLERMEEVAETVEEVAEKVEEVADEIGDNLPEGELKEMLEKVEEAAGKAAKAADVAQQVLETVQEMEDQVESYIDKAAAKNRQKKVN
ncbi:unnamed protein product [Linum tenue]|uniref:Plastid-targeted protein 2 n=1 Tax=Linum tenue TaxID=586396 RepID=A0AAV0MPH8_9ROSI|nr:unnamed protein product [Linum tenue]